MAATRDEVEARKRWEAENHIETLELDQIFRHNARDVQAQLQARPWSRDPHFFKHVKVSAIALLKMIMHARSGGTIEVMGLMLGRVCGDTMVVLDSFALPVQGTETRVNAGFEANEYMIEYLTSVQRVGRLENACGWYHSHPGYGCWLSGIDVSTEMLYQKFQDPFIAIVVDPTRTISAGKVDIGAFRTFPEGYKPLDEGAQRYQSIPLGKIEDFGVHAKAYYPLDVSFFRSSLDSHLLDLLWHKYWVSTLSSSPLVTNRAYFTGQIADVSAKLEQAEQSALRSSSSSAFAHPMGRLHRERKAATAAPAAAAQAEETPLARVAKDCSKMAGEQMHGLISLVMKDVLFNIHPEEATAPEPMVV